MEPESSEMCEEHEIVGSNLRGSNKYVMLDKCEESKATEGDEVLEPQQQPPDNTLRWRLIVLLCCFAFIILVVVILKWGMPFFSQKVMYPIMKWQGKAFSRPVQAIELVTSMAVLPVFLVPSGPAMWLTGMNFNYAVSHLLVTLGTTIGMILPYLTGKLYYEFVHHWLKKWPRIGAIVKHATDGSWSDQCLMVALARVSPFPYTIFNYAASLTRVRFWPYFFGSVVGNVPDSFNSVYSGKLMRALADAQYSKNHKITGAVVFNIITYIVEIVVTFVFVVYFKRILNKVKHLKINEHGEFVHAISDNVHAVMDKLSVEKHQQVLISPLTVLSDNLHHMNENQRSMV